MKFVLEIDCNNAAFHDDEKFDPGPELSDLLADVSTKLGDGFTRGQIVDSNGNQVGIYKFEEN